MRAFIRFHRLCLAFALALGASPAAAQQFPSQQRGLSADTAYQSGELDSLNLFNGNLSLSLPLGQPYPVGPAFSLSFALHYNSKVWDYDEEVCQQTLPTQAVPYDLPQPDKFANAGIGWLLTPGRLLDPSTVSVENRPTTRLAPFWRGTELGWRRAPPAPPNVPLLKRCQASGLARHRRRQVASRLPCRSVPDRR